MATAVSGASRGMKHFTDFELQIIVVAPYEKSSLPVPGTRYSVFLLRNYQWNHTYQYSDTLDFNKDLMSSLHRLYNMRHTTTSQ